MLLAMGVLLATGVACWFAGCKASKKPSVVWILALDLDPSLSETARNEILRQTADTLRRRLEAARVEAAVSAPPGPGTITVAVYGQVDTERIKSLLVRSGKLEFRIVDDRQTFIRDLDQSLPAGIEKASYIYSGPDDQPVTDHFLRTNGTRAEAKRRLLDFLAKLEGIDRYTLALQSQERRGSWEVRTYLLSKQVALSGEHVAEVNITVDKQTGLPEVALIFSPAGAALFEKTTTEHVRERLAIVIEDEVTSAPVIQAPITGGRARITLGASDYDTTLSETYDLALVLKAGALSTALQIVEEKFATP
jgi:preprotein translocase subunit SecD